MNIQQTHLNTPFIKKLHTILSDPENTQIITWDQTGTMIDILDQKRIQTQILPKFFRHSKFESFIRQLNLYGFKKNKKKNSHRFRHPDLVKGNSLFSIKSQRKFKNSSTEKLNLIHNLHNQESQIIDRVDSEKQKSEQKQSCEIEKTQKIQTCSFIENKPLNIYAHPLPYQNIYNGSFTANPFNYCQAANRFPNYAYQTVYLPNFNNILFYN